MSTLAAMLNPSNPRYETTGGRLVTTDGRPLPLTGATLSADAKAGVVRVTLEQTFRNPYEEPLRVTYQLPLPADGAVSGFAFRIGEQRIVGEVDTKKQARRRFEDAILEGKTAALLDQERSSLFTQEVGNVPPRTEVVCEVQIDQKLAWLGDGAWEWRFPTVVAPRYLGAGGRVADHAKVTVDVADRALPVKLGLSLSIRDRLADGARPESPSHPLHSGKGLGRVDVTFGDERGVGLDRDVVVRWRVADLKVGTELDVARPSRAAIADFAYGLLTLVPPSLDAHMPPVPRDLIVLLDTSGSMSGAPLDQARRVASALVDSLNDQDQLELIEFSNSARRWKRGPVNATSSNRRDAQAWLARLRASGGTEMRTGILEALAPLRADAQRQIVLITDGLIGFEDEVLAEISQRLPKGSRVHTVGVGSGVNRSLTQPAARAGRGVELVLGIGEDVEPQVKRLLSRTATPLVTNVEISGTAVEAVAPSRVPDLYGGAPAMVSLKLKAQGGTIVVRGDTAQGELNETIHVKPVERGEGSQAVAALFGRELVEDFELASGTGGRRREIDPQIERAGLDFQISTRLTSWVAVSDKATVDPRAPKRDEVMPHNLPYGMSAEGVGLRATAPGAVAEAILSRMASGAPMAAGAPGRAGRARSEAPPPLDELVLADASADEEGGWEREDATGAGLRSNELAGAPPAEEPAPEQQAEHRRQAPPAPSKPEAPRKKGFGLGLGDLAKAIPGGTRDAAKDERIADRAPAPATAAPMPHRAITARIVRRANGKLVLEIKLAGGPLRWKPAADARIELGDGTVVKADVVKEQTTADGAYDVGLTLMLTVTFDDAHPAPVRVHLASGDAVLDIAL
ncbi:MAG: VIT domain-containing protein [Myxococcota bacterium]